MQKRLREKGGSITISELAELSGREEREQGLKKARKEVLESVGGGKKLNGLKKPSVAKDFLQLMNALTGQLSLGTIPNQADLDTMDRSLGWSRDQLCAQQPNAREIHYCEDDGGSVVKASLHQFRHRLESGAIGPGSTAVW